MTKAETIINKIAEVSKDSKPMRKGIIMPSLSGALLGGVAAPTVLRTKGMPRLSLATMLAGAVTGSRAGVLLHNKMVKSELEARRAEKKLK
jgi:outer membrane lipoprotein SlyB